MVVAKIAVAGAGSHDQPVVAQPGHLRPGGPGIRTEHLNRLPNWIYLRHVTQPDTGILLTAQNAPQRRRDIGW